MQTNSRHEIEVLNGLIETALDSAYGYLEAAEDARDPSFKSLFERQAVQRRQVTLALQAEVRALGGKPRDEGSLLGAAHRVFTNLKNALSGDDRGVVNEVENGEDYIKAKFERALEDEELSMPVRGAISRAYVSVKAGHDQIRDLKHALQDRESS